MKAFVDTVGHPSLWYSIYALFEKRLGYKIYTPDTDWTPELGLNDPDVEYEQRRMNKEEFADTDIDLIICSCWVNEKRLYKAAKTKPTCRFIRLNQNLGQGEIGKYSKFNLMAYLTPPVNPNSNILHYFPESQPVFHYEPPTNHNLIRTFANYLPSHPDRLELWNFLKEKLPEYTFEAFGHGNPDGSIPYSQMSQATKETAIVYHVKCASGGFGLREPLLCGRPVITSLSEAEVRFEISSLLIKPHINAIDPSIINHSEIPNVIRQWTDPEFHEAKCLKVAELAKEIMDWEREANKVKSWLEKEVKAGEFLV